MQCFWKTKFNTTVAVITIMQTLYRGSLVCQYYCTVLPLTILTWEVSPLCCLVTLPSPPVSTPESQENPVGEQSQNEKFNQPSPSVSTWVSQENPVGEQSQNEKFNQPSPSVSTLVNQENPVGEQSQNEKFHQSEDCMYATLQASISGTFLQTLPDLVMPLKGHSLSPRSCPPTQSVPSERFGY